MAYFGISSVMVEAETFDSLYVREELQKVAQTHWTQVGDVGRERMSRMASAAAWGLEQWESMERYVSCIPKDTMDGSFYRAVLAIHNRQFSLAQQVGY